MSRVLEDLSGQRFGRLVVLNLSDKRDKSKNRYWECQCDCGNVTVVLAYSLKNGNTKSCGCGYIENLRKISHPLPKGVSSRNTKYRHYKNDAKKHGREFSLSLEQFINITSQDCHYCGIGPTPFSVPSRANGAYIGNGIDRKDNTIGYVLDNCVPCCGICNHAKSTLSYNEFMSWIDRLITHKNGGI